MKFTEMDRCPSCYKQEMESAERRLKDLHDRYGKDRLHEWAFSWGWLAKDIEASKQRRTLATETEIGFDSEGRFYCRFKSRCPACGFSFSRELPELPEVSK